MAETLRHLRWERHGRKFEVLNDQGQVIPNKFALTTRIGELNVDNGDGTFAPYLLSGAILKHGDSECEFADGWQTIRRLGQVVISQSRLYIQRDIDGVWTDVPHGVPTRNVAHDYPREGKCTAYLDFPNIQGYAQGARLQIGVEVGGGDRQIYGYRMRSPVAGRFRLEWVLEIPDNAQLSWIEVPTSRTDPTPIRVGGRIGPVSIYWSRAEVPYRDATVENIPGGGRRLHIFLGPYDLQPLEWLTIYPDTLNAGEISATNNDSMGDGWTGGYPSDDLLYIDDSDAEAWWTIGFRWAGIDLGGAPASIDAGTVITFDCSDSGNAQHTLRFVAENSQNPADFSSTHVEDRTFLTSAGDYVDHALPDQARNDESYSMVNPIQALIDAGFTYDGTAGHDTLVLACGANHEFGITAVSYCSVSYDFAHSTGQPARLTIVYTAGGGAATIDQLSFRARKDDGSESAASWLVEAENTDFKAPLDTNLRIRFLVNSTGDFATTPFQLEFRKSGDETWNKV